MADPGPELVERLRAAGCVFAEEESALLLEAAPDPGVLEDLVTRRVAGEPLELLLGWVEFCGLRVRVASGVFVPRRRTAYLVELAVAHLRGRPGAVVVDLCCGTGAIGVAIAARAAGVRLHAADLDPGAVACARLNVRNGLVHEGDLYAALPPDLRGRVDVLAVNAPYVPTGEIARMPREARDHERHLALDGGVDGLDLHRRVAQAAPEWLAPGGRLLIETSAPQAEGTAAACRAAGLDPRIDVRAGTGSVVVSSISNQRRSSGTMTR